MTNKHLNKTLLAASIATIIALQGCSDTTDDNGVNTIQPSGAVVDDYIAFSLIYVDTNNDGQFDKDREPYAYTDADGKFGGEYCKNPYDPLLYKFCLDIPENLADKPIRVEGGRDILTGAEYEATMSMKLKPGETTDLAITSFSTMKEALASLDLENLPSNIDSTKYQNINIEEFVSLLTASSQFVLGQSLNRQNLLSTRTSFNTFKYGIAIHKVTELIAAYLKQQDGNNKPLRAYMPTIYVAIAANFNNNSTINETTFQAIINEAAILNGVTLTSASDTLKAAQTANKIFEFNTNQTITETEDSTDKRRVPLAKAEILTKSAKKAVEANDIAKAQTVIEILTNSSSGSAPIDTLISDPASYQKIDFETAAGKISTTTDINNIIAQLREGEYTLADFVTQVIGAGQYIELTESNPEKITKAYFKETETTDTQHKGIITLCTYDSTKPSGERAAIFSGNWAWDELKNYQLRAEALGVQVSIEHLNPTLHNSAEECGADVTNIRTCLKITTPQVGDEAPQVQYFTSSSYYLLNNNPDYGISGLTIDNDINAWIENAQSNTDADAIQIRSLGNDSIPETVEQCFPDKEL